MTDIPVIRVLDAWRTAVAAVLRLGLSVGVALVVTTVLGWQPLTTEFDSTLLIVFLSYGAVLFIWIRVLRAVYGDAIRASRLFAQKQYAPAIPLFEKQLAYFEARPWMDTWRTVLFLDTSRFGIVETLHMALAECGGRMGDLDRAVAEYERCLAIRPDNVLALSGFNLIALARETPRRPEQDIELRYAVDRGYRGLTRWVPYLVSAAMAMACLCPFVFAALTFETDSAATFLIPWLLIVAFMMAFPPAYRRLARRMFLPHMERGFALVRGGDYAGAVSAFEKQYDELTIGPIVDRLRLLLLLDPTVYSYREWTLLYQVTPFTQLGRADSVTSIYKECLALNPRNVYAQAGLDHLRALQAAVRAETFTGEPRPEIGA